MPRLPRRLVPLTPLDNLEVFKCKAKGGFRLGAATSPPPKQTNKHQRGSQDKWDEAVGIQEV